MIKQNEFENKFKKVTGVDFNTFYVKQKPKLIWHLFKLTNDFKLAEDYADDAFVQALNKIEYFSEEKAQLNTWIYTIAENFCKRGFKEEQKVPSVSMDKEYGDNLTLHGYFSYNDGHKEVEKYNENIKKADLIKEAITSLPDKYRQVMILRELQHLSYETIAAELNINLSTIKSQIKKGRDIVRKKVERKFKYIDEHGLNSY